MRIVPASTADEHGNVASPSAMGMPGDHPVTTQVTVAPTDKGGSTLIRMTHARIAADSSGAGGWEIAFDKLNAMPTAT